MPEHLSRGAKRHLRTMLAEVRSRRDVTASQVKNVEGEVKMIRTRGSFLSQRERDIAAWDAVKAQMSNYPNWFELTRLEMMDQAYGILLSPPEERDLRIDRYQSFLDRLALGSPTIYSEILTSTNRVHKTFCGRELGFARPAK